MEFKKKEFLFKTLGISLIYDVFILNNLENQRECDETMVEWSISIVLRFHVKDSRKIGPPSGVNPHHRKGSNFDGKIPSFELDDDWGYPHLEDHPT